MTTASELATELQRIFGDAVDCVARSPRRLYVGVPPERLLEVFEQLRAWHPGFRLATSTVLDLREEIGVFHHFAINGESLVVTLKVMARKPDPSVPSLAPRIPAANWIEREMHDLTGVRFVGHPDPRRLVKAAAFPDVHPLRRDFDPVAFKEEIGEHLDY
ncbi:MAG: NADH-quinone oxidoreductase subunit C [Planctomycetes bacterium]|nr:NADH-quinone oxidoreductase subunit C [Planctomycetota bacterium]